jgi:hypothetical protein
VDFRELIERLHLIDVPTRNGLFTWNNKRGNEHSIVVLLDRFLLSEVGFQSKHGLSARVLPYHGSDHWPISLEWTQVWKQGPMPFRCEKLCLNHPNFLKNLALWWKFLKDIHGTKMYQFQ